MSPFVRYQFRLSVLLTSGLFVVFASVGSSHIENADLFDFGTNRTSQREVAAVLPRAEMADWLATPEPEISRAMASESVGGFGTIMICKPPRTLWVRFSNWIVSKFGSEGTYRWKRVSADERANESSAFPFVLGSFNGTYVSTAASEEWSPSGTLAVSWSVSLPDSEAASEWLRIDESEWVRNPTLASAENVVFLGHASRVLTDSGATWASRRETIPAMNVSESLEQEFAAHFRLAVPNARF